MEHFLRVSFKYKENPFEYDNDKSKNDKINDKINNKEKHILNVLVDNENATIPEISAITKISTPFLHIPVLVHFQFFFLDQDKYHFQFQIF